MTNLLGYPRDLPVCIVEKATTPAQRELYGTLETIAQVALQEDAKPPATIIIGNVVNVLGNGKGIE
jgi:siroheme synthase